MTFTNFCPTRRSYSWAFGDGGVIATEGADKVVALDMWFQRLDLDNIAFDQQTADIPRRFLFPEIVAESGNMISGRGDGSYEFIGPGAVELVFAFPPTLISPKAIFTSTWTLFGATVRAVCRCITTPGTSGKS